MQKNPKRKYSGKGGDKLKKGVFVICDLDTDYLYRLMNYLEPQISQQFQLHVFSNEQSIKEYANDSISKDINNNIDKKIIEILLISNRISDETVKSLKCTNIILLSDGTNQPFNYEYPVIYKYQSAQEIFRQIMFNYAQKEGNSQCVEKLKEKANLICFYSPWNEEIQTELSIAYGCILGEIGNTLYLNLKGYHGFVQSLNLVNQRNLIDLIYYFKNKEDQFVNYFRSIICKVQKLDYIPPVDNPIDIGEVTMEAWLKLLKKIIVETNYENIIVDLSDELVDSTQLLAVCNKIYVPVKENVQIKGKMEQLTKTLTVKQKQTILGKLEGVIISQEPIENIALRIYLDKKEVD